MPHSTASKRLLWIVAGLWALVLLILCLRAGISPHRQSSYAKDYAPAGLHWLHGEEIYSHRHHFVYSPPVAAFFAVFAALPGVAGDILWRAFSGALLLVAAAGWLRGRAASLGALPTRERGDPALPATLLLFLPLAIGNLNLGQMNVLVLVLVTAGVLAAERERWNAAAFLLAGAALIKIYPLAVGLLLALLYPRRFSWRLALALAGLFLASFALQRPGYVWNEYHQWFAVLGRDDRLDVDLYATWRDFGFLLRACGVAISDHAYRLMEAAAGGALAVFLWAGQRWRRWPQAALLGGAYALGCAWMMLFGPATEAATYVVLALPACAALTAAWSASALPGDRKSVVAARVIFTTAYGLLLLADVTNGWFHGLTHHLFMRALQPVAALLFAGGVFWFLLRRPPADAMLSHADTPDENGGRGRRLD